VPLSKVIFRSLGVITPFPSFGLSLPIYVIPFVASLVPRDQVLTPGYKFSKLFAFIKCPNAECKRTLVIVYGHINYKAMVIKIG
jgi:hypothetical protein